VGFISRAERIGKLKKASPKPFRKLEETIFAGLWSAAVFRRYESVHNLNLRAYPNHFRLTGKD
jgi:hypothetical protein